MKKSSTPFQRQGFVICPYSCRNTSGIDWAMLMKKAGLNTLGIHNGGGLQNARKLGQVLKTMIGHNLLQSCRNFGIDVEYELHAMSSLLPRRLFSSHPEWFVYNEKQKKRVRDYNFCFHAPQALATVCRQTVRLARSYPPTTGRYFLWQDDICQSWCRCPKCRPYGAADQSLLAMNAMVGALRQNIPEARLAFLAYIDTLVGPEIVKPAPGIFLEFAPIHRCYLHAVNDRRCRTNVAIWAKLLHLLTIFPAAEAHVIEYWLDQKFLQCRKEYALSVMRQDLKAYRSLGIRSVTSFATFDPNLPLKPVHIGDIMRYGECMHDYMRS